MYPHYHDSLTSECHGCSESQEGYTYGYEAHEPYSESNTHLSCIDPELRPLQGHHMYTSYQHHCSIEPPHHYTAYDRVAHGFGHPSFQPQNVESMPYPNALTHPWVNDFDQARYMRYLSPTAPAGFALSSNESSTSDYAISPDVGGSLHDLSGYHMNDDFDASPYAFSSPGGQGWSPGPSQTFVPPLPSTPVPLHQGALSMRDLQVTPDPQGEDEAMDERDILPSRISLPEELDLSEEVASQADSGLGQSIDDEIKEEGEGEDCGALDDDHDFDFVPTTRPRRHCVSAMRQSLQSSQYPAARGVADKQPRVHKQPTSRTATHAVKSRSKFKRPPPSHGVSLFKSFVCTFHHYGCHAVFASKNEWKRHVASQHLQLGYYRCDLGICSPEVAGEHHRGYNDFNRKDLFTQHCRRMHAPWVVAGKGDDSVSKKERDNFEKELEVIRTRCWVDRRKPPKESSCGFCGEEFVDSDGGKAWEERMEHVGRHLEKNGSGVEEEEVDDGLRRWALAEGVIRAGKRKGGFLLVALERAGAAPSRAMSTGRRRSGRLVGRRHITEEDEDEDEDENDVDVDEDDKKQSLSTEPPAEEDGDVAMKGAGETSGEEDASDSDAECEEE
ncbi:hypothetical protein A1O1_05349 [Capronia coronata CBS 617.96]|uniref:C2H2-type domain-containing protein n=1 Tax=Capronia coronata CBS 617.96 TaxID=1182541 RepID=W9Z1N7_9EURO|nr:uncharacterized protein A1O1_05349 [Capronia coronata CBS 617.96]EXJ88419.1 hypothetical protein A1O1_05349 [Capronia coronata CBS 617.96]